MGRVKKPLPVELLLAGLEGQMESAQSVGRELGTVKLILTVPGEDGDPAKGHHLHPVLGTKAQGGRLPPEHDAADGPFPVFQGEVMMSRGIHLIIGQLAADHQAAQHLVPIHETLDVLVDLAHGIHRPAHPSPSQRRWARMATPMALSVE